MKPILKLLAAHACALAVLACPQANAGIVKQSDGVSFRDSKTGYLWRTLAQYDGLDFLTAVSQLPSGYQAATGAQIAELITDAEAAPISFDAEAAAMGANPDMIWGYYGDGTTYAWKASYDTAWNFNNQDPWNYAVTPDVAIPGLSLFAVDTAVAAQAAVPEPATLALLGLGLAGLRLRGRRTAPDRQGRSVTDHERV